MPGDEELALAVYQVLRAQGGFSSEEELSRAVGVDAEQARRGRRRLDELGLIHAGDAGLEPVEPETALMRTMTAYQAKAAEQADTATSLQQLAQALMSVYRPAVADEAAQVEVEYVTDSRRKNRILSEMAATCRDGVDSMHPGPMPPMQILEASLARDTEMLKRGVRLRSIYPQTLLQTPRYTRYLERLVEIGAEVRLLDHSPCDVLIHDQSAACLPGAPGNFPDPMLLVRGAALVRVVSAFYEDFWLRAIPYEQARNASAAGEAETELTAQERVVTRLMAGGLNDDQIARKMGVSRRTVQRAVAKLMERLHASSRFEAGLKLAQDPEFARALRAAPPPSPSSSSSSPFSHSSDAALAPEHAAGASGPVRRAV